MSKKVKSDLLVIAEEEKAKREAELVIANEEKSKRDAELVIANEEKAERADELIIANKEKEKRASELIIANKELTFQNEEKEKRAAELVIANKELAFQITERKRMEQTLKKSENKFKSIYQNSNDAIMLMDRNGFFDCNPQTLKLFKIQTREEFIKLSPAELSPSVQSDGKNSVEAIEENISIAYREGYNRFDWIHKRFDGEVFYADVLLSAFDYVGERVLQATVRDITERKIAEEVIKNSDKQYRLLFDEMLSGFAVHEIICDQSGKPTDYRFLSVNKSFEKMTGLDASDILGKTVLEVLPETEYSWIERYGKVALTGEPIHFENYAIALGKHYEVRAYCPEHGKFATLINDITERKNAEDSLSELLQFNSQIINSAQEGIIVYDHNLKCQVWNPFMENLTSLPASEAIGKHPLDLFPFLKDTGVIGILEKALNGEKNNEVVFPFTIPATGRTGWASDKAAPFYNTKNEIIGVISTVRDITEYKLAEQELLGKDALLNLTGYTAKVGGWEIDAETMNQKWTDESYKIHEVDLTFNPNVSNGINFYAPSSHPVIEKAVQRAIEFGEPFDLDLEFITNKGNYRWVHSIGKVLQVNGKTKKVYGSIQDITERKKTEEELIIKTLIFESSIAANSISDNDGIITHCNSAFLKIWGYDSQDEVIGKPIALFIKNEDEALKIITSLNESGIWEGEYIGLKKDRTTFNAYGLATKIQNRKKENIGYFSAVLDISHRKQTELQVKESEEKLRSILDATPFPVALVDSNDNNILYWSRSAVTLFGHTAPTADEWYQIAYPDNEYRCEVIERWKPFLEKARLTSQPVNTGEYSITCSDGSVIICELYATFIKDNLVVTFNDITDRKQAEESKVKSTLKFKELTESISDVFFALDKNLKYTYWNKASEALTGVSTENAIGKSLKDIFTDNKSRQQVEDLCLKVIESEKPQYETITYPNNDNIIHEIFVYPNIEGVSVFVKDITERKKSELLIKEKNLELTLTNTDLIKAKEKAEESDRLKSAFLTNMSHEIRTPMNGIIGFTELLKEPHLSVEEQQDFIQTIQISGARMLNTINSIVDMSKIESGLISVDIKETNLNEKIEFTYKFFKPEVEKKGLQFFFKNRLTGKEAIIKTDNEKVYGILTNLVRNAIKFTNEGSIEFGYEKKGEYLEFFVKDTGIGIPQKQRQIIFERFRQGSESNDRGYEGSGLGLSISKSYVEMLGGRIWVESEEGKGSTLYFTIPYNSVTEDSRTIEDVVFAENKVQIKKLKMLIVEDDEISYSLLSRIVQKISKEILHAITGVQAVESCRNNPDLDLVLMDIRMPMMNGLEATQQIRQFNKDVIIIAQTAYGFSGDCEKAMEAGCNDYISKPINKTLLYELINKHCNKKKMLTN